MDVIKNILDKARRRADGAEVFNVSSDTLPVRFRDNRLKSLESTSSDAYSLRVIKDGRVGFVSTTRIADIDSLIDSALAVAQFGSPAEFTLPGPAQYEAPEVYDRLVADLSPAVMVERCAELVDAITEFEPEAMVESSVTKSVSVVRVANTAGLDTQSKQTQFYASCGATLVEGESLLRVRDYCAGTHFIPALQELASSVKEQMAVGRHNVPMKPGDYPVIFSPLAMSDVLRCHLASVDGNAAAKGVSPWRDKLDETVAHARMTLVDDGLLPYGLGTSPFDGEGVPSSRTPVIEEGVLRSFLVDLRAAARLGHPLTGNARRAGKTAPSIGPSNLVLLPGQTSLDSMLSSIDQGLLIHSLMGAWASNPYGGQISGNIALGFKVEKGKLTGRVKDCMVYFNAFDAWRGQLVDLSTEVEQRGNTSFPYVMFEGIAINTKG